LKAITPILGEGGAVQSRNSKHKNIVITELVIVFVVAILLIAFRSKL
jgi:hypothetical protein